MQEKVLYAELREEYGKSAAKSFRRAGKILANYYIHGEKNKHLVLETLETQKFLASVHGVMDIKIKGQSRTKKCLVREIQYDPVSGIMMHIDFMGVRMTEKISTTVKVRLLGVPAGVKDGGGTLSHLLHEIHVECLTKDLPEIIELDVSALIIDDNILVKDIQLENVTIMTDPDQAVVSVKAKKAEEVLEVAAEEGEGEEEGEEVAETDEATEE